MSVHIRLANKAFESGDVLTGSMYLMRARREVIVKALEETPKQFAIPRWALLEEYFKLEGDLGLIEHILCVD